MNQNHDDEGDRERGTGRTEDPNQQDVSTQHPQEDATASNPTDEWTRAEPTVDLSTDTSSSTAFDDWSDVEEVVIPRSYSINSNDWYDGDELLEHLSNRSQNDQSEHHSNDRNTQDLTVLPTSEEWSRILDNRLYQIALDDFNEAMFIFAVLIYTLAGIHLN